MIWFSNLLLIDVVNKLKVNKKKFHATISQGYKFQSQVIEIFKISFKLEWKISVPNKSLRLSFIQVEGYNVGQYIRFNFYVC